MKQLRETHLPVVITTPARLKEHYPQVEYSPVFGPAVVLPYPGPGPSNEVAFVLVIVESDRMADIYRAHEVPDAVLNEDLSRILGHELYTHVIPLSRSRRVEDICPDPRLEDVLAGRMLRGCSVERENELREDLGLPPRSTYLDSGLEFEEGALDLFVLQARQAGYSEEDILRVQSWMREVNRRNASLSAPGG